VDALERREASFRVTQIQPSSAFDPGYTMQLANTAEALMSSGHSQPEAIVFVVDDDVSVRESLELLIRSAGLQPHVFESAEQFLARSKVLVPSCLVLDMSLPDVNGLDLQQRIAADRMDMPIIFITGYADVPITVQAMKAGAVEFLTKPFDDEVLLKAIRSAIERYASLTRREKQVMALVVDGLLNKQVGSELGISEITVKAHRGKAMDKMKADSLADLVKLAAKLRLAPAGRGGRRDGH
jgi:FixJ family two-component response regulator